MATSPVPTSLPEIDAALSECGKRLRLAKSQRNAEALLVYRRQLDRLLSWRTQAVAKRPDDAA